MSDPSGNYWSNNSNAPRISRPLYLAEKYNFAGTVIGAILYGAVVVLFFRCMSALINPISRTRGIKWWLVAHTVTMFSLVTVYNAINLHIQSISYIDNREFPGVDGGLPGPFGYQFYIYSEAISVVTTATFPFNQWIADGLLLYRCYVIFAKNYWAIAFPCLMYLATVVTGSVVVYRQASQAVNANPIDFGIPYFSISLGLNLILTLMIVIRIIRHSRDVRDAIGSLVRPKRLYGAIVTIFVESSALYAVVFLLYIAPWGAGSSLQFIFFPILSQVQVIAQFLIVLRVAKQRALVGNTIVSGDIGSLHLSQEKSTSSGTLPGSDPVRPTDTNGRAQGVMSQMVFYSHSSEV